MDVHNNMKKGHNALFLSQPGHNVYQFMYANIEAWLKERTNYLKLGYYRIHNDFITNEMNVKQIYSEYRLGLCSFDEINSKFPFTSFTQIKNLTIEIEIAFEILASVLYSQNHEENTYAWKLQVLFQLNDTTESDKFESVKINDLVVGGIRLRDVLQHLPDKTLKLTLNEASNQKYFVNTFQTHTRDNFLESRVFIET